MFTIRKSLFKLTTRHFYGTTSVRSFLTEAYSCNEVWNERLQCSLLKKVDPEVLYNKLSTVLESDTKQMSSIDLDIFANSLTDEGYLDELEDLIHRFRLSAQTGTLLPSTHHAVVRYFLATKNEKDLIRILKDRLNYGIFPDYYLSNLLMDTFIKEKNFRNAAVIASNQMLQEEFDNDITKTMGLYSCLKYVTNPVDWEETKEEIEETSNEDDEEEDTRVRVDFLRNPYFDDHFDLSDGDHLVGKTMLAISKTDNSIIGNSFKTIGLAYYNQWNELAIFLRNIDSSVYLETVELAVTAIDKRTPENEKELKDALSKLKIENKSLTEETENAVKKAVSNTEENEIQIQSKIYKKWESVRREELHKCMDNLNKMKRLEKVKLAKENLQKKEQLLYFFDNEHKHDLINEEKLKRMKKKVAQAKSPREDLTYVPPEIRKPGFKLE